MVGDFLVCGISDRLHQNVAGFDEEIAARDLPGNDAREILHPGVVPDSLLTPVLENGVAPEY